MDLKQKIGQMIVVRASGYLKDRQRQYPQWEADNQTLQRWLEELNLGGVILLGASAVEVKERSQMLQSLSKEPLLVAADIEEGVGQRFSGLTWFPPPMSLGAIAQQDLILAEDYAYQMGVITAKETLSIGINWLLAPVVDVNNNPRNPVINIRAFSDRQDTVSQLTTAFIKGAQSQSILTTAKHFPGHGDTATDSHLDLPTINCDAYRLETLELPPFQAAIKTGVDSVMTAHLNIPAWDEQYPATLSPNIITGKLRGELGFTGLIVTDALIMGGITKYATPEEVAVMAVSAGIDVLLMPDNPKKAIAAIYEAVRAGIISAARIEASWQRIKQAKAKVFSESKAADSPTSLDGNTTVKQILRDSLKTGGNLPLQVNNEISCRNLIVVDDLLNSSFLNLSPPAIALPAQRGFSRQILDRYSLDLVTQDSRLTLLQLFIRGNPFRGSAGLTSEAISQYEKLIKSDRLIGLIIYGSPYVLDWFLARIKPDLPWVFSYGQMELAQEIANEAIFANLQEPNAKLKVENFGF